MADFEMPDIDATLSASYDAAESGEEYVSPTAEKPVDNDASEVEAKIEATDANTDQSAEQGDEPASDSLAPLEAPTRWSAEDKAVFSALPREAQDLVLKRERDVESHLSKRTQELSEQGKRFSSLEEVIGPRRQSLVLEYGSEANALNTLFALSDMASKDPAGFINYFAQQRGIDLGSLHQEDQDSSDPEINALRQELAQLRGTLTQSQQLQAQEERNQLIAQIEAFKTEANDKGEPLRPHFEAVRQHMSALVNVNPDLTLQDAYDQAVWANPETRKQIQESQTKAAEERRKAEAKAKADAAEKAASTRPRAANGQFVPSGGSSILDTMSTVYDSMNG